MKSKRLSGNYRPVNKPRNIVLRSRFKMERRHRIIKISQFILFCIVICLVSWGLLTAGSKILNKSEYFKIKKIEITGIKNISYNEIIVLLPFRKGYNLLKVNLSDAKKNLASCKPEIKNIDISRGWQKIEIELEERQPVACININGQRHGLDQENKVFPLRGPLYKEFFPEIVSANESERLNILKFMKFLAPETKDLYSQILKFYSEPVNNVIFEMKDGTKIFWGDMDKDSIKPKLKRLAQVYEDSRKRFQSIEYVNFHYFNDGRIIVKPKIQNAALQQIGKT